MLDHRRATPEASRPADRIAGWLAPHGIDSLRVCLGLVITGFGVLKFFPASAPRNRSSPTQWTS